MGARPAGAPSRLQEPGERAPRGARQTLQGVWWRLGWPRPPGSTGPSFPRGGSPLDVGLRARTPTGPGPRAPGKPASCSPAPLRAGLLRGAHRPQTCVTVQGVAMSSVFGKPRAGSGPQSTPLEVNLAILGRRGAGKSGEWCRGTCAAWCGTGRGWGGQCALLLGAGSSTGLGSFLHPGGSHKTP